MTAPRRDPGHIISRIRTREAALFDKVHEMEEHCRQLDPLFEKLHFHELDARDKVAQRLQMPLVAFLALAGFIGHLLQNARLDVDSPSADWFWLFIKLSSLFLAGAGAFFFKSVIGKYYSYHPLPQEWKAYQAQCETLYAEYPHSRKLVNAAMQKSVADKYIECATFNGAINGRKSADIFWLLRMLIIAALFTFAAFGVFFTGSLDKNRMKSRHLVEIVNPEHIKGDSMPSSKPPPPPPPPPARHIREDRGTPTQQKPPPPPKDRLHG